MLVDRRRRKHGRRWLTEPSLVAFYDIRPGNGAGLFLQLWSPHGAPTLMGLDITGSDRRQKYTG